MDYEIVIIGGGVIGLAIAAKLSHSSKSILLVERHASFGNETSSRNSEVIHAGIYYPPNSLKAELCSIGNRAIYDRCQKFRIPYKQTGKYIVAVTKDELEELEKIKLNANSIGAKEVDFAKIETLRKEEPNVIAEGALWSPMTGIVDSHVMMESFLAEAKENGVDIAWRHNFEGAVRIEGGYEITFSTEDGVEFPIKAEKVVNSAGLRSDIVAREFGIDIDEAQYRLNYVKGNYFRIKSSKKHLVNHLIYPVPAKNMPGLGIHVTLDLNGEIRLGPDVEYMDDKEQDYSINENLASKFYDAASSYLKGLEPDDVYPDYSGIRPKLQKKGEAVRDFVISEESSKGFPGLVNLIGIESPGLTCSIPIAEKVAKMLGY